MNRSFLQIILTAAAICCIVGCVEQQKKPTQAPRLKIKISDLKPVLAEKLPPEIQFRILTFEMPAENFRPPMDLFSELTIKPLRFNNYQAFRDNGFSAGFGQNETWPKLAEKLRQANARRTKTDVLFIFDDADNDIFVGRGDTAQTVFYTGSDGTVAGKALANGQLAWRINAQPVPTIRQTADVKIQPIFKPRTDIAFKRLLGKTGSEDIVFDSAAFALKMSPNDFVLLGPARSHEDELTLSSLFFSSFGDFILPEEATDEQDQTASQEPVLKLHKQLPLVRVYIFVCIRIQD